MPPAITSDTPNRVEASPVVQHRLPQLAPIAHIASAAADNGRVRFCRPLIVLVSVLLTGAACASSTTAVSLPAESQPVDSSPGAKVPAEETELAASPVPRPSSSVSPEPGPVGQALAGQTVRYRWTVSLLIPADSDQPGLEIVEPVTVDVDRERHVALLEFDDAVLPESLRGSQPATSVFVAYVDDVQLMRGFDRAQLLWVGEGEPDSDTWYVGEQVGGPGIPDILPDDVDRSSLLEALGLEPDGSGRAAMSAEQVDAMDRDGEHLFAALERANINVDGPLSIEIENDDAGRVAQIRVVNEGDGDADLDMIILTIDYDIDSFDVPTLESAVAVPGWETTALDPIAEALSGASDVAMRLNVYLGREFNITLTPDNTLVRVSRLDISAGPEHFEQWQLTRSGSERLLAALFDNPAVASGEYNVYHPYGVGLDIGSSPGELNAHPDRERGDVDYRADVDALIDLLDDPTWLGDDILSGPDPWVPETLTIIARPAGPNPNQVAWPLSTSIRDLGNPSGEEEDAVVICLVDGDVAPVWALLGGGTNYAHIALDDGEAWDAGAKLNWPGYRLLSDPCGPDYERYLVASGAASD